jgi:hypothetical protein
MRKLFLASIALIGLAGAASATPVQFTSSGSFSNVQNCLGCSVTNGGTQLNMSGLNQSYVTAVPGGASFSVPPNQQNVIIGSLSWVNNASILTDQAFTAVYTYNINFTQPGNASDSQAFNITITQPTNPPGDTIMGLTNATLAGIGFGSPLITAANLHFGEVGDGTYNGLTGAWYNPEHGHSTLNIYADFVDTSPQVAAVPEASTWAMMLLGFAGIVFMGAKRRREGVAPFRLA